MTKRINVNNYSVSYIDSKLALVDPAVEFAQSLIDNTKPGQTMTIYLTGIVEQTEISHDTLEQLEKLGVIDARVPVSEISSSLKKGNPNV